jgi:hypothetical protein
MNLKILAVAAVSALALAGAANATGVAYMTGSSNPWDNTSNDDAMTSAFGTWTKYQGFDASAFTAGYSFIFLDGSDANTSQIDSFLGTNLSQLQTFVDAGGRAFVNIARNRDFGDIATGFGTSIHNKRYDTASYNASLTADGLAANLNAGGAGKSWTGFYFSHDNVNGTDTCYVAGDYGCIFGSVSQGLFVGGQTTANYHSSGGDQLLVNELKLASSGGVGGGVPEPGTWALMLMGFGGLGATLRLHQKADRKLRKLQPST